MQCSGKIRPKLFTLQKTLTPPLSPLLPSSVLLSIDTLHPSDKQSWRVALWFLGLELIARGCVVHWIVGGVCNFVCAPKVHPPRTRQGADHAEIGRRGGGWHGGPGGSSPGFARPEAGERCRKAKGVKSNGRRATFWWQIKNEHREERFVILLCFPSFSLSH